MRRAPSQDKTKERIIAEVARNTYLSNDVVKDVVNEYLKVLRKEIVETGRLAVKGIFSIQSSVKKAHVRRDLHTGKDTQFPESEYLRVSLSKQLRDEFHARRKGSSPAARSGHADGGNTVNDADDFDADLEDMLADEEI